MRDEIPKVSVIIPTRNRSHCLGGAVESVLSQTCSSFEVIIVNDGSTDDTGVVADKLATGDSRISVVHGRGEGQSSAVNLGLEHSVGEIAIMLSDDDILYPECLAAVIPVFQKDDRVVVVGGEYDLIDWDGKVLSSNCSSEIDLKSMLVNHSCNLGVGVAFRIDAAKRAGGWDPRYRHVPDLDFWMRMALEGESHYLPTKLGAWRVHDKQISTNARVGSMDCAKEHIQCVEEFLEREDLPEEFHSMAVQAKATAFVTAAVVLDPDFALPDRRFLVMDRKSIGMRADGHQGGAEEREAQLVVTAEERLELIQSLNSQLKESHRALEECHAAAEERLRLVESLDADLRESLSNMEEMRGVLQEVQSNNSELKKQVQEGILATIRRRLRF